MWGFCVRSLFCYTVLCVISSFAILMLVKRELVALLLLSIVSWVVLDQPSFFPFYMDIIRKLSMFFFFFFFFAF